MKKYFLQLLAPLLCSLLLMQGAAAVDLETLVMPGPVSAPHAEYESDCAGCHAAFARDRQNALCVDCHTFVGADQHVGKGFHGLHPEASKDTCASCHTEHAGRDADIIGFDPDDFDHQFSDFELVGEHADVECADCHEPDELFRDAPSECIACHREDDIHAGGLGEECATCHVPKGWDIVDFDHAEETGFALLGGHADITCVSCHDNEVYENTAPECIACHREDDSHDGLLGEDCGACHNEFEWTDRLFDHDVVTDFPLLGSHAALTCESCHTEPAHEVKLGSECIDCHQEDDPHEGQLGENCDTCHNETEWTEDVRFDHGYTDFPLIGNHQDAECDACHETARFSDASTACVDCHLEDDEHDGRLGDDCGECHNPVDWARSRFDHFAKSGFALDGAHSEVQCTDCHRSPLPAGQTTPSRCIDCHRNDDIHDGQFGNDCARCHSTATFEGAERR